jgi:DNA replication and repair protein RecF
VFSDSPERQAVRLSALALRHFRNLRSQELELPAEGVALIGDNAQGKSNFLEAIYYLETLRSFRGVRDEQMVAFDADVFRVVGTTESGDERRRVEVAAAFQKKGKRKKVSIDGTEPERMADALGHLSAVIFSPADVELVSGGPSERRRFLDIVLSLNEPGYLGALQDYRKILLRRNAALKGGEAPSVVSAWNHGLIRSGAEIMQTRRAWVEHRHAAFADYYHRVSGRDGARMTYRPSVPLVDASSVQDVREAFAEALGRSAEQERRMGVTVVGPHRDDVRLRLEDEREGLDLRDYGSGGQRRTAALALRLVEAATIRDRRTHRPLILLDDVFAELDGGRSERILELIETEETGQVVLTAPKEADVRVRRDALPRWRIRGGEIST